MRVVDSAKSRLIVDTLKNSTSDREIILVSNYYVCKKTYLNVPMVCLSRPKPNRNVFLNIARAIANITYFAFKKALKGYFYDYFFSTSTRIPSSRWTLHWIESPCSSSRILKTSFGMTVLKLFGPPILIFVVYSSTTMPPYLFVPCYIVCPSRYIQLPCG